MQHCMFLVCYGTKHATSFPGSFLRSVRAKSLGTRLPNMLPLPLVDSKHAHIMIFFILIGGISFPRSNSDTLPPSYVAHDPPNTPSLISSSFRHQRHFSSISLSSKGRHSPPPGFVPDPDFRVNQPVVFTQVCGIFLHNYLVKHSVVLPIVKP